MFVAIIQSHSFNQKKLVAFFRVRPRVCQVAMPDTTRASRSHSRTFPQDRLSKQWMVPTEKFFEIIRKNMVFVADISNW